MSAFLKLKLATAVIDTVLRDAQHEHPELRSQEDVLLLEWLHDRPGLAGAELAWRTGRTRANTHRTLRRLQKKGVVEPLPSAVSGKTCGWELTEYGHSVHRRLRQSVALWDFRLAQAVGNVEPLVEQLLKVMQSLLRPLDKDASFRQRLLRPERPDKLQEWDL